MPGRYPLTVLAMGFSMDSLKYASSTIRDLASKNSLLAPNDPLRVGPWFLPPSKEWQAIHPSEVYNVLPISKVGFLMTTFGSSDDNLSPAFGRISILKLPGVFSICLIWVFGDLKSRFSLEVEVKSSRRV